MDLKDSLLGHQFELGRQRLFLEMYNFSTYLLKEKEHARMHILKRLIAMVDSLYIFKYLVPLDPYDVSYHVVVP